MILNFTPWIIIIASFIGIVIIVLRKIPVLLKLPFNPPEEAISHSLPEKLKIRLKGLKYSSYQPMIADWLEKNLRKLRILILKIDNIFISLIGIVRERSQIWRVRSRAWMEQHQLKKIQKLKILEKLDKAEVLESIQKLKEEAETEQSEEKKPAQEAQEESLIKLEEKKYIDLIAQDPRNFEAYKQLGLLYFQQGNKEDAKECFRQVLKINPGDFEIIKKMKELG